MLPMRKGDYPVEVIFYVNAMSWYIWFEVERGWFWGC
jgi:hypothetical protein